MFACLSLGRQLQLTGTGAMSAPCAPEATVLVRVRSRQRSELAPLLSTWTAACHYCSALVNTTNPLQYNYAYACETFKIECKNTFVYVHTACMASSSVHMWPLRLPALLQHAVQARTAACS